MGVGRLIKVLLEGQPEQIDKLVQSFEVLNQYHIFSRSYLTKSKKRLSDVRLDLILMNGPKARRTTYINLQTVNGKKITLEMLDAKVIQMEKELKYIHGKSYDIFT